jgi:hypothetical protein
MSRVAGSPACFVGVEIGDELEPGSDAGFPAGNVDGPGKDTERARVEVAFTTWPQCVGRIERLVTAVIIDDISPDLENPQPTYERLVDRSIRELPQVVQISAE